MPIETIHVGQKAPARPIEAGQKENPPAGYVAAGDANETAARPVSQNGSDLEKGAAARRARMSDAERRAAKAASAKRYKQKIAADPERAAVFRAKRAVLAKRPDRTLINQRYWLKIKERREKDKEFAERWRERINRHNRASYERQKTDPARLDMYRTRRRQNEQERRKKSGAASAIMRRDPRAVYALVMKALQRTPEDIRDDVAASIYLAIMENQLAVADIAAKAQEYIRAHYRMFDRFKTLSLDAPVPGMDGVTYKDRLVDNRD